MCKSLRKFYGKCDVGNLKIIELLLTYVKILML